MRAIIPSLIVAVKQLIKADEVNVFMVFLFYFIFLIKSLTELFVHAEPS